MPEFAFTRMKMYNTEKGRKVRNGVRMDEQIN